MPSPKMEKLLAAFDGHLRRNAYGERTRKEYPRLLLPFLAFLEKRNIADIARIRREHLLAYHTQLINARKGDGSPYHASTLAVRLAALKTFFDFLLEENFILTNPAASLKSPKVPQEIKREPLTEKEVHALLKAIPTNTPLGYRDRTIAEVFYATGIRVTELSDLLVNDVHLQEKILVVRKGKGGRGRLVPLSTWAASYLKGYLKSVRPQFETPASGQTLFINCRGWKMSRAGLCDILKAYGEKAGIERPVTPHILRHTFATHLLRHGADIRAIQEMLGHAKITTTQAYTRIEISDLQAVHRRCHPRERYRSRVPDLPAVLTILYHVAPKGE